MVETRQAKSGVLVALRPFLHRPEHQDSGDRRTDDGCAKNERAKGANGRCDRALPA